MECDYYNIYYKDILIAERMTLETAIILIKGLMREYWREPELEYTIQKIREDFSNE